MGTISQDLTERKQVGAAMQVLRGAMSAHLIMSGYSTSFV